MSDPWDRCIFPYMYLPWLVLIVISIHEQMMVSFPTKFSEQTSNKMRVEHQPDRNQPKGIFTYMYILPYMDSMGTLCEVNLTLLLLPKK